MKLRCVTWNIMDGGMDDGDDRRMREQMKLLAGLGAHVIAIQEAKGWAADGGRVRYIAEGLLGMRGFLAASSHHGCDLAVFVRESAGLRVIRELHVTGSPYWHGLAVVALRVPGYPRPVHAASVHLAPSSPELRLVEAEEIKLVAGAGDLIIGGDFNAAPGSDPLPEDAAGAERRKLDRRAAHALADAGLFDVGEVLGDTTSTVGQASQLAYRCDRWHTSLLTSTITSHKVTDGCDLSDHEPVAADFDLDAVSALA